MFTYNLLILLTSTAFVDTNAKYGIPLSRYTVFLKTVLLSDALKKTDFFIKKIFLTKQKHFIKKSKTNGCYNTITKSKAVKRR